MMADIERPAELLAHSQNERREWHQLHAHLAEVARIAHENASKYGMPSASAAAYWLGWWHDPGKAREDFQEYLRDPRAPHGPDHSSVGMLRAGSHVTEALGAATAAQAFK